MSRSTVIALLVWSAALTLTAHTVSMSTSSLEVHAAGARLEIRVPAYEARHVAEAARAIPAAIQINGAGPASANCREENGAYICRAEYKPAAAGPLRVRCLLARTIVVNHVHVMHATREGLIDQAVFDSTLEEATLTFRRAGPIESAVRARPHMLGMLVLLMIAAGVLAATPRDALLISGAFLLPAAMAAYMGPLPWQLTPGFLEAALTVVAAYAAFEVIALESRLWRLMASALLGMAFGRYALTLTSAPLSVAMLAASIVGPMFGIAWITQRFPGVRKKLAGLALAAALVWLAVTLIG